MKKMFVVLAALMFATPAMASKARVGALQGADFLVDSQTIFTNPAHIHANGQYLTFEMGATSNTGTPKAEGGLFRKGTESTYGAYLGHINDDFRTIAGVPVQENPVEIFYGKNNWAASVSLSNGDKKTVDEKETSLIGRFGMVQEDTEFYGSINVIDTAENATDEYKGKLPTISAGFEKNMGDLYFTAEAGFGGYELTDKATDTETDSTATLAHVSIIDRSLKSATRELYYGAAIDYLKIKDTLTQYTLPLFIGLETNVASWLVFRGSVQQSFLLGSTKDETAANPENDTPSNDTTVAVGTGIIWGDFTLDGTLAASTTGQLNGNQVLTNASITYKF